MKEVNAIDKQAENKLGIRSVKPEECLFIDDSLENVEVVKKLGMKTVWWNKEKNKTDLLRELTFYTP